MWSASSVMMRIKAVTRSLHSKKSLFEKEGFPPNKLADRQGDLIFYELLIIWYITDKGGIHGI